MNPVIKSYENDNEENRLTRDYARKTEFAITTRAMGELLKGSGLKILDLAAGTGAYSFYLADRGHEVIAVDITPRHIMYIQKENEKRSHKVEAFKGDACDLSRFADNTFDVVLNMGAYYHLPDQEKRAKAMAESIRVLKNGGILFTSYISRYFVFPFAASENGTYLENNLAEQVIETGEVREADGKGFWTDAYYAVPDEMEDVYMENDLAVLDHFAQDGVLPMISEKTKKWTEEQFALWIDSFYQICREKSILGSSNHVMIAGRKEPGIERYRSFSEWLDRILKNWNQDDVKAFNFNLYEGNNETYDIQLIGTRDFMEEDSDWACDEIFTTGEDICYIQRTPDIADWQEGLFMGIKLIKQYMKKGIYREILQSALAVGVGFIDGDIVVLYQNDK